MCFWEIKEERNKMSKVYEYYKEKIERDAVPTMNEVDQELYLIETVRVMKQAKNILFSKIGASSNKDINEIDECLAKLQEQINTAEETILQFEVNMGEILQSSELFGALSQIQAQSTLYVNTPMIYIHVIENNLGSPNDNPYVQPVINQFFARNFSAKFVDAEQADLLISGTVNTRSSSEAPNEFGIYQVFGDMTISMSNGKTGEKLLEKSFNNIQGAAFQSNREAANQSIRKISEKITEDFL